MRIEHKYDDIIKLEHHVSKIHPRMSIEARSAQFAPFSAVTGYEDEVSEVVILKVEDNDDEDSDEESYVSIEDEEILNKVFEIFKEKFKDDFDFVD